MKRQYFGVIHCDLEAVLVGVGIGDRAQDFTMEERDMGCFACAHRKIIRHALGQIAARNRGFAQGSEP